MPRPIEARIDSAAFRHNYLLARALAEGAHTWAVIKANAYGHGLMPCAEALRELAQGFALLDLADAEALRAAGFTQPILLLEGAFEAADLREALRLRLNLVVHCEEQLRMLELEPAAAALPVHLKLNTGMNRLGFAAAKLAPVLQRLRATNPARAITLATHFACADDETGIAAQLARFDAVANASGLPHSVANSAALLRFPVARRADVRPGIMLYGASPFPQLQSAAQLGLRAVMTLESRIIAVQSLQAGDSVGYGARFTAPQPMRVGVVACGYADGYPRHAGNGCPVLVDGQRSAVLGRVSMDMLVCDLTALPNAGLGSLVQLWGDALAADEVAAAAGTISYELFCALAARVPQRIC